MGSLLAGNALLGLLAAWFWGIADFSGGMGAKRAGGTSAAALQFVRLSHLLSIFVLVALALVRRDPFPRGWALVAGLCAGFIGAFAISGFYAALGRGAMGASAAVSGLLAAAIPAMLSIFTEGLPGWRRGLGFLVAGVAIWLIAAGDAEREERSTVLLAVGAGVGFGLYFVAMRYAGAAGVIWPLATVRLASITTCSLILLGLGGRGGSYSISGKVLRWAGAAATFDTAGNLLFVAATRAGRLDVASVLASLYPASTILLAAWRLKERPTRRQGWGMAIAGLAVVLITI